MRLLVRDPIARSEKVIKTHEISTLRQRVYKTNGISTFPSWLAGWAGRAGWLPLAGWRWLGWLAGWLADWLTGWLADFLNAC